MESTRNQTQNTQNAATLEEFKENKENVNLFQCDKCKQPLIFRDLPPRFECVDCKGESNVLKYVGVHDGKLVVSETKPQNTTTQSTKELKHWIEHDMKATVHWAMLKKWVHDDFYTLIWIGQIIACPVCDEYLRHETVGNHFAHSNKHKFIVKDVFKGFTRFVEYLETVIETLLGMNIVMDRYDVRKYLADRKCTENDPLSIIINELNISLRWIETRLDSNKYKMKITVLNSKTNDIRQITLKDYPHDPNPNMPPQWFFNNNTKNSGKEEEDSRDINNNNNNNSFSSRISFSQRDESEEIEKEMLEMAIRESEKEAKRKKEEEERQNTEEELRKKIVENWNNFLEKRERTTDSFDMEIYDDYDMTAEELIEYEEPEQDEESDTNE